MTTSKNNGRKPNKKIKNGRRPKRKKNGRQPQKIMEDNLKKKC